MEDNWPPQLAKQVPLVIELKPCTITAAPTFQTFDAKPFTRHVTEKDKVAMGVLLQTMGTWTDPWLISRNCWTMVSLGG